MTWKPFQFLYQVFKGKDQRLFDIFERIHMNLEALFDGTGNTTIQAKSAEVLPLQIFFQDLPGVSINLRRTGIWLVLVSLECHHNFSDGQIEFQLSCNGIVQPGIGIMYNSSDVIVVTGTKFWVVRASLAGDSIMNAKVRARITVDNGHASYVQNGEIAAIWQNNLAN